MAVPRPTRKFGIGYACGVSLTRFPCIERPFRIGRFAFLNLDALLNAFEGIFPLFGSPVRPAMRYVRSGIGSRFDE